MKTRQICLFGIPFDTISFEQALLKLHYYSQLPAGEQKICTTPNPEMIVESRTNKEFFDILHKADFSLADGAGILWASGVLRAEETPAKLSKSTSDVIKNFFHLTKTLFQFAVSPQKFPKEIKSRVAGSDIFSNFIATSQSKIFLLGGHTDSAAQIAEQCPNVVGYYDQSIIPEMDEYICQQIVESNAEVLFVALGAPKQELWIQRNLSKLPNIRFAMGVGGAFDFLTGYQKRAPLWMQNNGFEWLYRLITQPWRIGRIWKATVGFFFVTLKEYQKHR